MLHSWPQGEYIEIDADSIYLFIYLFIVGIILIKK